MMAQVDRRLDPSDPINILDRRVQRLEDKLEALDVEGSLNMTLIEDVLLESAQQDITFADIPSHFRHLRIIGHLRSDGGSGDGGESVALRMNGDTGNNYDSNRARINNVDGLVTSERLQDDFMSLTGVLGVNAVADHFGIVDYFISNYLSSTFKAIVAVSHNTRTHAAGGATAEISGGTYHSSSPITEIKIFPAVSWAGGGAQDNWDIGSRLTLYGIG